MDASQLLFEARRRAGLTLRELAERAGTSHSTLAAYEHGRKTPRFDTLDRLCRAAGFALSPAMDPRPAAEEREHRRQALLDALALADAFPLTRTGPLDAPVFGRRR